MAVFAFSFIIVFYLYSYHCDLHSFPTRRSSDLEVDCWRKMRKFDLSLRSSRSSYFATFRHQLTILSKTDAKGRKVRASQIGRAVQQECRDRSRMPSSA